MEWEIISNNLESFNESIPTNKELIDAYAVDSNGEIAGGWISKSMMVWFLDYVVELGEEKLAEEVGASKETVHVVRLFQSEGMDEVFNGAFERLEDESHGLINGLFAPYFWGIIVVLLLLLIYPIIEVFCFWKKRKSEVGTS